MAEEVEGGGLGEGGEEGATEGEGVSSIMQYFKYFISCTMVKISV